MLIMNFAGVGFMTDSFSVSFKTKNTKSVGTIDLKNGVKGICKHNLRESFSRRCKFCGRLTCRHLAKILEQTDLYATKSKHYRNAH